VIDDDFRDLVLLEQLLAEIWRSVGSRRSLEMSDCAVVPDSCGAGTCSSEGLAPSTPHQAEVEMPSDRLCSWAWLRSSSSTTRSGSPIPSAVSPMRCATPATPCTRPTCTTAEGSPRSRTVWPTPRSSAGRWRSSTVPARPSSPCRARWSTSASPSACWRRSRSPRRGRAPVVRCSATLRRPAARRVGRQLAGDVARRRATAAAPPGGRRGLRGRAGAGRNRARSGAVGLSRHRALFRRARRPGGRAADPARARVPRLGGGWSVADSSAASRACEGPVPLVA
jgi:hypothetical protein